MDTGSCTHSTPWPGHSGCDTRTTLVHGQRLVEHLCTPFEHGLSKRVVGPFGSVFRDQMIALLSTIDCDHSYHAREIQRVETKKQEHPDLLNRVIPLRTPE